MRTIDSSKFRVGEEVYTSTGLVGSIFKVYRNSDGEHRYDVQIEKNGLIYTLWQDRELIRLTKLAKAMK